MEYETYLRCNQHSSREGLGKPRLDSKKQPVARLSRCDFPPGKILVDVSNNRRVNQYPESNAEYLASLLPQSVVVKGFNVISAWAMQQASPKDASRQVLTR